MERKVTPFAKLFPLLLISHFCVGQLTVKGVVTDSATHQPIDYLLVGIFHYKTEKIIVYAYTNEKGEYKLDLPYVAGVFTLKTSSLTYNKYERDIVLGELPNKEIELSFIVTTKTNDLKEVVIKTKAPPMIIKKDTIIYDVTHYTQSGDQTLEDVLRKMPGFEVLDNGELKINGRPIGKVLIDGQEFLKGGAALSTRSIAPQMVERLEVRLDEKENKLKESLLSNSNLVVLDIKLKDDVAKSLFGKARLTSGYQNNISVGGYANLFSLGKKEKYHFLGEYDAFGKQTISLSQISNLGREAVQRMLSVPADYNRITENPEFNKEVYGFKDFTRSRLGIVGITAKYDLSKYLALFMGTYNTYTNDGIGNRTTQRFLQRDSTLNFTEQKYNLDYNSKNKLSLEYDKDNVKASYDFNAVISDKTFTGQNFYQTGSYQFLSNKHFKAKEFYHNALFEWLITSKISFQAKAFYGQSNKQIAFDLQHNQPLYIRFLKDDNGGLINHFTQQTNEKKQEGAADAHTRIQSSVGYFDLGLIYFYEQRNINKNAYNNNTGSQISLSNSSFAGATPLLSYSKWMPYVSHSIDINKIKINNKVGLALIDHPVSGFGRSTIKRWEYQSSITLNFNETDNINASYSQIVSGYPLLNIAKGYDFVDFQTFTTPQTSKIEPKLESTIQAFLDKTFVSLNTVAQVFSIYGKSQTYNTYASNTYPFIGLTYNQLQGNYLIVGMKIVTLLDKLPLSFKLEPSYLLNQNDNIGDQGQLYSTITRRQLLQLRVLTSFQNKSYNFEWKTKFSNFQFENILTPTTSQQILLTGLVYKQDLLNKRFYFQASTQYVNFWGSSSASLVNIDAKLQYTVHPFSFFIEGENLLNNQYFIKQNILPTYFVNSQQYLFSRFTRFGLEYTFGK